MSHTVMVLDDSAPLRAVIRTTLKLDGYDVVEASNGREALALLAGTHCDLILSDINMPMMTGIAFLREVRRLEPYARTPILLLTIESGNAAKEAAKAAGATGFITKPVDGANLIETVGRLLAR